MGLVWWGIITGALMLVAYYVGRLVAYDQGWNRGLREGADLCQPCWRAYRDLVRQRTANPLDETVEVWRRRG